MRRVLVVALVAACSREAPPVTPVADPSPPSTARPAPAAPHLERTGAITWITDDYPAALAAARKDRRPLIIDAWAKWCHTCLSMQSYVFPDPAFAPLADRFVWLTIDTEKPSNADVVAKFTPDVWPTFFAIDPVDESLVGRWVGAASVTQFREFLTDAERVVAEAHANKLDPEHPLSILLSADRASNARRYGEAAGLYAKARRIAPADWPRHPDALVGQVLALWKGGDAAACVDLALAEIDRTVASSSASDFVSFGLACAEQLPKQDARVDKVRRAAERRLALLVDDRAAPLSADDRGDAYGYLIDARKALGDDKGARAAAEARLALLEQAADDAPGPAAASTFDWARADTYLMLGRGDDAVAFLTAREAQLPEDYNAAHWLSRVYLSLGRADDALAAVDRALGKVTPPRRARLLSHKIDILEKLGRRADAIAVARESVAHLESLPASLKRPGADEAARKRLEALEGGKP